MSSKPSGGLLVLVVRFLGMLEVLGGKESIEVVTVPLKGEGGGGRRGRALRNRRVLGRPRGGHASDATCRGAATDVCLFEPCGRLSPLSATLASLSAPSFELPHVGLLVLVFS